jgi:hypothetical protein
MAVKDKMASTSDYVYAIIFYILSVSLFIGLMISSYGGNNASLGVIVNTSEANTAINNLLYDGNTGDLGINVIDGTWNISSVNGLQCTGLKSVYWDFDKYYYYAAIKLGNNTIKNNNEFAFYNFNNYDNTKFVAMYIGTKHDN